MIIEFYIIADWSRPYLEVEEILCCKGNKADFKKMYGQARKIAKEFPNASVHITRTWLDD